MAWASLLAAAVFAYGYGEKACRKSRDPRNQWQRYATITFLGCLNIFAAAIFWANLLPSLTCDKKKTSPLMIRNGKWWSFQQLYTRASYHPRWEVQKVYWKRVCLVETLVQLQDYTHQRLKAILLKNVWFPSRQGNKRRPSRSAPPFSLGWYRDSDGWGSRSHACKLFKSIPRQGTKKVTNHVYTKTLQSLSDLELFEFMAQKCCSVDYVVRLINIMIHDHQGLESCS